MQTFYDLQQEVKRRATRDQSGPQFDTATKNAINAALFRTNREVPWRVMRRKTSFRTKHYYEIGSGAGTFTIGASTISVTGATFLTEGVRVGRRIKLEGDSRYFNIRKVTAETDITLDFNYSGSSSITDGTYKILGQEEYNLPVQAGHRMFMWHEAYGYPQTIQYITDPDFYSIGTYNTEEGIPTHYRMWGEDMVIEQPKQASVMRVSSSSSSDTSIQICVFGTVSGFPDYEIITTNSSDGTTAVSGSKSFSSVERVVKYSSSVGRITVDANSANTIIAVLPVGDTTAGILYRKVQLYPLPDDKYDIFVQYYKDPYRLVNDNDVHEMGQDFDEAIILLAVSKIKGESEILEGTKNFFSFWKDEIKSLKKTNADKIDWAPRMKKPFETATDPLVHPQLAYKQAGAYFGPRVW